jgi:6-phospho-beta-glucosidase
VLSELNAAVEAGNPAGGIAVYKSYLNRRNASYMRLEGAGESAFKEPEPDWNPFEGATGYHRIAVEAMRALDSAAPSRVVLNVANGGALPGLQPEDVIETACLVDQSGARPVAADPLPEAIRPLVTAVKQYERLAIRAALEGSLDLAILALAVNPICGDWDRARDVVQALVAADPEHLGYLAAPQPAAVRSAL